MTPDLKPAAHGLKRYTPLPEDDECTMNFLDGSGYLDCSVGTAFYLASEVDSLLSPPRAGMTEVHPAEEILTRIEAMFPNWKSYRDLEECIEVTLHHLRNP